MKHTKFLILTTIFIACGNDDDVTLDKIIYETTGKTVEAVFFAAGETEAPMLQNFPENSGGTISYNVDFEGVGIGNLTIQNDTGVILWTEDLQTLDDHSFSVTASTDSGEETTINMVINNPIIRTFSGTYDDDNDVMTEPIPFSITLDEAGIVTIDSGFDNSKSLEEVIFNETVEISFQYDDDDEGGTADVPAIFDCTISENGHTLSGDNWTLNGVNQGFFTLSLDLP